MFKRDEMSTRKLDRFPRKICIINFDDWSFPHIPATGTIAKWILTMNDLALIEYNCSNICHGVGSDVCMSVRRNLKFWVLTVKYLFPSWIQSQNIIQTCNYVCLDTSFQMHAATLKDQVTYALAMMSMRQSYKRAHALGLVSQLGAVT